MNMRMRFRQRPACATKKPWSRLPLSKTPRSSPLPWTHRKPAERRVLRSGLWASGSLTGQVLQPPPSIAEQRPQRDVEPFGRQAGQRLIGMFKEADVLLKSQSGIVLSDKATAHYTPPQDPTEAAPSKPLPPIPQKGIREEPQGKPRMVRNKKPK